MSDYSAGGRQVQIHSYRMPDTAWSLEVVDEHNNSTVWDDLFETDEQALALAMQELNDEGIDAFITRGPGESMHWGGRRRQSRMEGGHMGPLG